MNINACIKKRIPQVNCNLRDSLGSELSLSSEHYGTVSHAAGSCQGRNKSRKGSHYYLGNHLKNLFLLHGIRFKVLINPCHRRRNHHPEERWILKATAAPQNYRTLHLNHPHSQGHQQYPGQCWSHASPHYRCGHSR